MPSIPKRNASMISTKDSLKETVAVRSETAGSGDGGSTPCRRRLRSDRTAAVESSSVSPITRKSPRQCINSSPNTRTGGLEEDSDKIMKSCKSHVKRLSYSFATKQPWNPQDPQHMSAVKEALHVSTVPCSIVCREDEQQRILEFCKGCMEQEKAGSLYICGCSGTGNSLSMEKVKQNLLEWAQAVGLQPPNVMSVQCTFVATTFDIFSKILGKIHLAGRANISTSPLKHLQKMYAQKQPSSGGMISSLLKKIAAASGDMRKALCICRSAIDLVEAEAKETAREQNSQLVDNPKTSIVKIDHMALALSRTFRSPTVDTIQSLPQHQQ